MWEGGGEIETAAERRIVRATQKQITKELNDFKLRIIIFAELGKHFADREREHGRMKSGRYSILDICDLIK